MRFRPCIDIHDGKVKQIVGGSLKEQLNQVKENFVSEQDASFYAKLYRDSGLTGGHAILLNKAGTPEYEADRKQVMGALSQFPGGLQIGGGITCENATSFLEAGASHVIVTSYVFRDGLVDYDRLEQLKKLVGRERLVLDLSCRLIDGQYRIVTDRWQKQTKTVLSMETLEEFSGHCNEFLIHAVDVEGKARGIEVELAKLLGKFSMETGFSVTYAGGVGSFDDLKNLKASGRNCIDVTIGSALDLFGGAMPFEQVLEYCNEEVLL